MLVTLTLLAYATPLVHSEDSDDDALQEAAKAESAPLEPVALEVVRKADPWLRLGGEVLGPCQAGEIEAEAVRGHLLYGEFEKASARIAEERLRCGATRSSRADLERSAGILALMEEREADALKSFATAKGHNPELAWDDGFPAELRAVFARAVGAVAKLTVYPGGAVVDGGEPGSVAVGLHTVSVGGQELIVRLVGDDVLAVPGAYPEQIGSLEGESERQDLSLVLAGALGDGEKVAVLGPAGVWTGTTGRVDWKLARFPDPVGPASATTKRSSAPWWLLGTGAVVAGVGYSLAATGSAAAHQANEELGMPRSQSSYDDLLEEGKAANTRAWIGQGVGGAGVGVAIAGGLMVVLR